MSDTFTICIRGLNFRRGINLIYSNTASVKKYFMFNGHGDVVQLSDISGNIVGVYTDNQSFVKALAVAYGGYASPEVHRDSFYGHCHDAFHKCHV